MNMAAYFTNRAHPDAVHILRARAQCQPKPVPLSGPLADWKRRGKSLPVAPAEAWCLTRYLRNDTTGRRMRTYIRARFGRHPGPVMTDAPIIASAEAAVAVKAQKRSWLQFQATKIAAWMKGIWR